MHTEFIRTPALRYQWAYRLGYLYCPECIPQEFDSLHGTTVLDRDHWVRSKSAELDNETCETCGTHVDSWKPEECTASTLVEYTPAKIF